MNWKRFEHHQLCMLGTLRRSGWPRISPCELDLADGELLLGMMWRSPKALDLLRDDRCVLHSATSNRNGSEGDFKLYGNARAIQSAPTRDAYFALVWDPHGGTRHRSQRLE